MIKKILLLTLLISSYKTVAQEDKYYIQLFTDSVIYGDELSFNSTFLSHNKVIVDNNKYNFDIVKSIYCSEGRLVNARMANAGKSIFCKQETNSKLNIYTRLNPYALTKPFLRKYKYKNSYYSIDHGDLKIINYKNLKSDIAINSSINNQLLDYHKYAMYQTTTGTIADIVKTAGILSLYFPNHFKINEPAISITAIISGFVIKVISNNYKEKKLYKLNQAIHNYNNLYHD